MIDFNIDNYLRISFSDVVLVLISSALIILFAKHFFWDKLLDFIAKRQALVQENIDQSVRLKKDAMQEKEKYEAQMKEAGSQAHEILETARAQANSEKARILQEAKVQADRVQEQAREEIERERRAAETEMKNAISQTALAAAAALVKEEMNDEKRRTFVDAFIEEAGESDKW